MSTCDEKAVKDFGRFLIDVDPNRRTLLAFFQHLKFYTLSGRDIYWERYSPLLEKKLPDSQHKFWDYQEIYEKYTHPSRRIPPAEKEEKEEEEDLVPLNLGEEKLLFELLEE